MFQHVHLQSTHHVVTSILEEYNRLRSIRRERAGVLDNSERE
jgi:hypothetical protein